MELGTTLDNKSLKKHTIPLLDWAICPICQLVLITWLAFANLNAWYRLKALSTSFSAARQILNTIALSIAWTAPCPILGVVACAASPTKQTLPLNHCGIGFKSQIQNYFWCTDPTTAYAAWNFAQWISKSISSFPDNGWLLDIICNHSAWAFVERPYQRLYSSNQPSHIPLSHSKRKKNIPPNNKTIRHWLSTNYNIPII